jgi:hypothetical protein
VGTAILTIPPLAGRSNNIDYAAAGGVTIKLNKVLL